MDTIVIIKAARTPIGRFLGGLSKLSAIDLACIAGEKVLESIDRSLIDQVVMGNVLSAGLGMNIARQIGVQLKLPITTPAYSVNMMCASGMQAIILAAQALQTGQANAVLAGGTESMTNAPHLLMGSRRGYKLGDQKVVDSLLQDGLHDAFDHQHMACTAQRLADQYHLSRQDQDRFALQSQTRYQQALQHHVFDQEITPAAGLTQDEHPRSDTTLEGLADLKPVFSAHGSITAGNASGINDGAALVLLTRQSVAQQHGWQPIATLYAHAAQGCDPALMGIGPVGATQKLLAQTSDSLASFDHIELNEAFAAQALACIHDLQLHPQVVNPYGGAIALGHPIGATGARLIVHLAHQIAQGKSQKALATLCVGGGMGVAVALKKA